LPSQMCVSGPAEAISANGVSAGVSVTVTLLVAFVTGPALLVASRHHVALAEPITSAMAARIANFVLILVPNRFIFEVPFG
jgi:hypothetical protein